MSQCIYRASDRGFRPMSVEEQPYVLKVFAVEIWQSNIPCCQLAEDLGFCSNFLIILMAAEHPVCSVLRYFRCRIVSKPPQAYKKFDSGVAPRSEGALSSPKRLTIRLPIKRNVYHRGQLYVKSIAYVCQGCHYCRVWIALLPHRTCCSHNANPRLLWAGRYYFFVELVRFPQPTSFSRRCW